MRCKEYIFRLTSGQLAESGLGVKLAARYHCLLCPRCRRFTRNNRQLDKLLDGYRQHLKQPDQQP